MRGQKCNKKVHGSSISVLTMGWLNLWSPFIRTSVWKIIKNENFCAYIATITSSKCWFKQLHILFFMNENWTRKCSSSIELKIWTIATTYFSSTYFGNEWDNNCDALMTCQIHVRGLYNDMINLVKSKSHYFSHGLSRIRFHC
jgi:hypothetical protein